jgi:hypothetical protein
VRCLFYIAFTVDLFDRRLKGVIAPFNEEHLQSLSTAQLTRASALRVKQRQTLMFVRLSTLEHYDFTEKIALPPKTRV